MSLRVQWLVGMLMLMAGCSFGSDDERAAGGRVEIIGFDEVGRREYLLKGTYYVEISLDATRDEVMTAADRAAILDDEDFELRGKITAGDALLGLYSDRATGCQVNLDLESGNRTVVRVGIVCVDPGSSD
jgi:hypothetical protein